MKNANAAGVHIYIKLSATAEDSELFELNVVICNWSRPMLAETGEEEKWQKWKTLGFQ